jgi:hypothetical protein
MVGFLVDHPAYHLPSLLRAPEKALITVIDEGHLGFLKDIGLPKQATLFCPHGGPPPLPVQRMAADRPIDLLFIGNIGAEPPLGLWLDRNAAGDAGLRQILAEAHDAVREDGEEPYAALVAALGRAGRGMAMTEIAGLVVTLEGFVARSRRLQVLKAIRSRRVTILGTVAPEAVAELAHHDLRGAQSFAKGLSLMAGTKILLNSRMTFARGAHERVFYGLSRGAVVATEPSSFLAAELAAGLGMLGLPKEEDAIDRVLDGMLADPAALDACREQGLAHYARHHTWVERVGRMLGALAEAQLIG